MDGQTLASDGFERVGSFRYINDDDRWEWSDAVARMHGYAPGSVEPTTELILSHKHPEDKPAVSESIDQVRTYGAAFSSKHRIIDTSGDVHVVVVVADRLTDDAGAVIGTGGVYVDITEAFHADMQKSINDAVASFDENRAQIMQAIGMLRMAYGVSADNAFEVLKWRSQQSNVKLRILAAQLADELSAEPFATETRTRVDHVLLTVHERTTH